MAPSEMQLHCCLISVGCVLLPSLPSSLSWCLMEYRLYHTEEEQGTVSTVTEGKASGLCQMNQDSFAAGMHWYS